MQDFSTAEEVRDVFLSIFNDTQQAFPGLEGKEVSYIYADICTPPARLRKPLSKDGFLTLENRPKPLAGHLYGVAKIVTGGRNPKSKPSLPHARTALSRQKATRALHKRLAPRRCVERRAAQKETRRHCYFHLRSRRHNHHLLQQVLQRSLRQHRHRRHRLQRVLLLAAAAAAAAVASAVTDSRLPSRQQFCLRRHCCRLRGSPGRAAGL